MEGVINESTKIPLVIRGNHFVDGGEGKCKMYGRYARDV